MTEPAGLKSFQTVIDSSTLYGVIAHPSVSLDRRNQSVTQIAPNIQIAGNSADVYGSQVLPNSPPTSMTKMFSALLGIRAFDYVPNYLYIDPVFTDPTAVILTGVESEEIA